jgi:hypothetical protein
MWINNAIRDDLKWAADHIENSTGIHLLKSKEWTPEQADVTIYCDACMEGMGFWFPDHSVGYFSPIPFPVPVDIIFYFEALCVAAALEHAHLLAFYGSGMKCGRSRCHRWMVNAAPHQQWMASTARLRPSVLSQFLFNVLIELLAMTIATITKFVNFKTGPTPTNLRSAPGIISLRVL